MGFSTLGTPTPPTTTITTTTSLSPFQYTGELAPVLANAMQDPRYPELLVPVCQGLQNLIRHVRHDDDDDDDDDGSNGQEERKINSNPLCGPDYECLSSLSKRFLPTLFSLLDSAAPEETTKIKAISDTISIYATIAPPAFVSTLFKKLVKKMLEATQSMKVG